MWGCKIPGRDVCFPFMTVEGDCCAVVMQPVCSVFSWPWAPWAHGACSKWVKCSGGNSAPLPEGMEALPTVPEFPINFRMIMNYAITGEASVLFILLLNSHYFIMPSLCQFSMCYRQGTYCQLLRLNNH